MVKDVIELSKSTVRIDENGIIISEYKKDSKIEIEDAIMVRDAILKLTGGKSCVALVDLTNVKTISKEARNYFSSIEFAEVFKAAASFVSTPISRIIGNFFLGINRPAMPVRLFDSKDGAIVWLKGYME